MQESNLTELKILVVDDQPANVLLIRSILERSGYTNVHGENDPRYVLDWVIEHAPDLIILDLHMPQRDGFEVIRDLQKLLGTDELLPILVITADATAEVKRRALNAGASDFLTKPFDHIEVRLRVRNLLQTRLLHLRHVSHNRRLEHLVREQTAQLELARLETVERLAMAAEFRDDVTGEHIKRVGRLSMLTARELDLVDDTIRLIERAAPLHDVGKIGIPDHILLKPERLNDDEWELMKRHTTIGARLLAGTDDPLLKMAETIALSHHERWDGNGYPHRSARDAVPVEARIVAVADVFDALTHDRPYKTAWSVEAALEEISDKRGTQFAPEVVDAFLDVIGSAGAPPGQWRGFWTANGSGFAT